MKKVLMLGPSLNYKGGMAQLEATLLEHWPRGQYKLNFIGTIVEGNKWIKVIYTLQSFLKCILQMIFNHPDIVHIHFSERASVFRKSIFVIISKLFACKVVLHAHGAEFETFYTKLHACGRVYVKFFFRMSDSLIVLSGSWRDYYSTLLKNKVPIVLYNPVVIPPELNLIQNEESINILTLGKLGRRKGTYDLIEAMREISKKHPKTVLHLAGDGELDSVSEAIECNRLQSFIKLHGWTTGKDKEELLSSAMIYVLPSYNEGLPLSVLEAMAHGLPIITTPIGGIPEVVVDQENGILVPPGDIKVLVRALDSLISNSDLRMKLGTNARALVSGKFSIEEMTEALMRVYDNILM